MLLTIRRDSKSSVNLSWNRGAVVCHEPFRRNSIYFKYDDNCTNDVTELFRKDDIIWSLMKVSSNELSSVAPIWAAYNSLITERKDKTIVQQLPILNGSPTCWENLYRVMKDCEKLNKELSNGSKTVILFDLQLYAKAICLQVKPDICDNYVFRTGELHAVFTSLKVLGKLVDGSGLDQAFQEAGRIRR